MAPPFAECGQEIVDRFLFRQEVAQKLLRVARKGDTLLKDQLIDRRMSLADVLLLLGPE